MERDFSEQLKKYRRERGLTQLELADRLGVSNKTISRWESAGAYPDAPMLVPLARALGVSTDDLLDGEKPLRNLTQADWQNLLSYAFAIGGGVFFYLLKLFVPAAVCYLIYLGCLAYGVYLQKYYCYRSRWFRLGWVVMNFSVNVSLLAYPGVLAWVQTLVNRGALPGPLWRGWGLMGAVVLAVAGLLTTATLLAVAYACGARWHRPGLHLGWPRMGRLVPALGSLLLAGFWGIYLSPVVTEPWYDLQWPLYGGLLALLMLVCAALYGGRGRRGGLWAAGVMAAGGLLLPLLGHRYVRLFSGVIRPYEPELGYLYQQFWALSSAQAAVGLALCVLCTILACLHLPAAPDRDPA